MNQEKSKARTTDAHTTHCSVARLDADTEERLEMALGAARSAARASAGGCTSEVIVAAEKNAASTEGAFRKHLRDRDRNLKEALAIIDTLYEVAHSSDQLAVWERLQKLTKKMGLA